MFAHLFLEEKQICTIWNPFEMLNNLSNMFKKNMIIVADKEQLYSVQKVLITSILKELMLADPCLHHRKRNLIDSFWL